MVPQTPNFESEARAAVEYEGLPPLLPKESTPQTILFTNLTNVWIRKGNKVHSIFNGLTSATDRTERGVVGVKAGSIVCVTAKECEQFKSLADRIVDLEGGAIQPGLVTYGSSLGLQEIAMERSTVDGPVFDPLTHAIPKILGEAALIRAEDGLRYQTRDSLWVHLQKFSQHSTLTIFGQAGLPRWSYFGYRCPCQRRWILVRSQRQVLDQCTSQT
jgi:hypothetical protein